VTVVLALVLCLALPGVAGGVLLSWSSDDPGRPGVLIMRGLSCGVAAWLISSGLVELTVGITKASAWVSEAVLAVASVVILVLPRSRKVLRHAGGEAGYLAGIVLVSALTWLPIALLVLRTTWSLIGSTPWYYLGLAQRVANVGHVPSTATEWGTTLPFLDDYRLLSTGTATLLTQTGGDGIPVAQAVAVVSAVLLGCGAALLANALGAGRLASLVAPVITITTGIGGLRLSSYRPEALGLGLSLLTVACFLDWFRRGERASLVAGCLLGVTLANVHGIALLAAVTMLVAAGLATIPRHRVREHLIRVVVSGLVLIVSVVVGGVLLGGISGATQVGDLPDRGGIGDPTWDFTRAIRGLAPTIPPTNHALVQAALRLSFNGAGVWVVVALALAVVGLIIGLVTKQRVARRALVFSLVTVACLAGVAAVLALGWSSYVPRRTGSSRLIHEATLLVGPFVACGLACLLRALAKISSGQTWRRSAAVAVVTFACVLGFLHSVHMEKLLQVQRPQSADVTSLRSLDVPSKSVVLTNAYTEGYVAEVMGATGLLEGRAPYTYPKVLERANRLLREARTFYRRPCRHLHFLDRNHVSYVVAAQPGSFALGTPNIFYRRVQQQRLEACPRLTRVLSTPHLLVFRVDR
jgi:hypothetical protein